MTERIAILGLGLMGASLGLALKALAAGPRVVGYARRERTRQDARTRGIVDEVHADPATACADADVVVLCVPILTMPELLASCRDGLKSGAVVTDVGSTKAELTRMLPPLLAATGAGFLGSHPICGSEQRGLEAGTGDLYQGSVVVLTPLDEAKERAALLRLTRFWEAVGARVHVMAPDEHDRVLARTSHLPHMVASLLAATVGREEAAERLAPFCGTGFRDTTRIAGGSPEIWHDILESNEHHLLGELEAFEQQVRQVIDWLSRGDQARLAGFLSEGKALRQKLLGLQDRADRGADA